MDAAPELSAPISQLRRGAIEFCVLALLDREEAYGFELVRQLSNIDGLVAGEGTIYPLFTRLRRSGMVSSTWRESASGPPRRYYNATEKGRNSLLAFAAEWRKFRDSVDGLIAQEGDAK